MRERQPAQIAADNTLDDAIRNAAHAYEIVGDGEIITQWAVVYAAQGEDDDKTIYGFLFPGGSQPSYVSIGLFRSAERVLLATLEEDTE